MLEKKYRKLFNLVSTVN